MLLFQTKNKQTSFYNGFNDWKEANEQVKCHKQTSDHRGMLVHCYAERKITPIKTQYENKVKYWREVLTGVVSVVKVLAVRELSKETTKYLVSYLMVYFQAIWNFLSEYDPFLSHNIDRYSNKGTENVPYLSYDACDKFVSVMGTKVLNQIVKELNESHHIISP